MEICPNGLARIAKGAGRKAPMSNRLMGQVESGSYSKKNADPDVMQRIEAVLPSVNLPLTHGKSFMTGESGAEVSNCLNICRSG
jgi:hypothetical protein